MIVCSTSQADLCTNKEEISHLTGLISFHAYACLDVRECKGHRLLKLKNPWGTVRWKGRFSPFDHETWRDESLQVLLNYDYLTQMEVQNGIFWILYEDVMKWFSNLAIAWDPESFACKFETHNLVQAIEPLGDMDILSEGWKRMNGNVAGPKKFSINMRAYIHAPQYKVTTSTHFFF